MIWQQLIRTLLHHEEAIQGTRGMEGKSPLVKRKEQDSSLMELKRELSMIKEREVSFEAALFEKVQREAELQRTIEESKEREAYLENELANMWVLVAKLRRSQGDNSDISVSETRQTDHFGT